MVWLDRPRPIGGLVWIVAGVPFKGFEALHDNVAPGPLTLIPSQSWQG